MTIFLILVLAGLLLIGAEVFIPGGVVGVMGLLALLAAVIMGYNTQGPVMGTYLAAGVVVLAGLSIFGWAKYFPKTRFGKGMTLSEDGKANKSARADLGKLLGELGTAQSDLRPGGIARIGSQRVDVVAEGTLVPAGTAIKVIKVAGNRVIVRPAAAPGSAS